MDLPALAALIRRPAVRTYDPSREVPASLIEQVVDAARWTGSARNRQPWRFIEVRDRDTLRVLSALGAYAQFVEHAPVVLAIASADNGYSDTEYDVGRITQSCVLGAAAVGLGSCPATIFPDENVSRAEAVLGISGEWRPRHLLALGYPLDPSPRLGPSAVPYGRHPLTDVLR